MQVAALTSYFTLLTLCEVLNATVPGSLVQREIESLILITYRKLQENWTCQLIVNSRIDLIKLEILLLVFRSEGDLH